MRMAKRFDEDTATRPPDEPPPAPDEPPVSPDEARVLPGEPIPPKLRFEVLDRDGFRCRYCGRSTDEGAVLQVDHVVPTASGGSTTNDNLVTSCRECSLGRGASDIV
jgi:5-methylcytosine-specific restriction endonuclease McrA